MPCSKLDGVVAQLVERLVRNEKVAGSIPVGSTIHRSSTESLVAFIHEVLISPTFQQEIPTGLAGLTSLARLGLCPGAVGNSFF